MINSSPDVVYFKELVFLKFYGGGIVYFCKLKYRQCFLDIVIRAILYKEISPLSFVESLSKNLPPLSFAESLAKNLSLLVCSNNVKCGMGSRDAKTIK